MKTYILILCLLLASCSNQAVNTNTPAPANNNQAVVVNSQTQVAATPVRATTGTPIEQNTPAPSANKELTNQPSKSGVTLASFDKLKTGMSYAEVAKILGSPGKTPGEVKTQGGAMAMYSWTGKGANGDWSVAARFDNGKLVSKTQFGLNQSPLEKR